ncbi:MAG: hypothetical protein AUI47_04190 [Acidobacteria bacterium 13_1_40CM_2_68_5]|nr:MAG: hypothetical protein AUI47_04190 [Acidobacteria bacterium 13_1_40CM_2_68_5]
MKLILHARKATAATAIAIGVIAAIYAHAAQDPGGAVSTQALTVQDAYPHVSRSDLVVFQSIRVGGSKLFAARLDGSDVRQLMIGPGKDVMWSARPAATARTTTSKS